VNDASDNVLFRYWGKAGKNDVGESVWHPLVYHCLDVAAVGYACLRNNAYVRKRLAQMLGLDEDELVWLIVFFLGLHDIGKFARHFQALQPALMRELQGEEVELPYVRHDALGELLWKAFLHPYCAERGLLGIAAQKGRRSCADSAADYWMHTALGHHGRPVNAKDAGRAVATEYFPALEQQAVEVFFDQWYCICLPASGIKLPSPKQVKAASWWLAGLTVLCDWLGSNQDYFAMTPQAMPLAEYWQHALNKAETAIAEAGMVPALPAPTHELTELFGDSFSSPTPLQAHCLASPLEPGAGFYLLEDITGAGKTEAALILAHRLMASGAQRGLYFALPTMATANAMFERMGRVYRRFYTDDSNPSLVLAHGARRLHEGFRGAIDRYPASADESYGDDTEPAQFRCAAWLADSPKKSLLAEVGVGTVDQAVLGILPSRHQCLRLFGLFGKVLIIDEVHAYEAYLFRLLAALITFHAASGGSIILLSATLPLKQRRDLFDAFYEGIGQSPRELTRTGEKDYPLVTHASANAQEEHVVASRKEVCRTVHVKRVDAVEQVEALMVDALDGGKCVCWIRNTVHDARKAYRELRERHPGWNIDLFHARYALGDRLDIETRVVNRFGKAAGANERTGHILIATPVVEQSLDIDFDEMISDLAPMDLIIQRAGRLQRHRRDTRGNVIDGPDQRGQPTLHLFAPEPVDEPDEEWFASFLPKAAYVYDNHAQLWLGLRLLTQRGSFTMPDDARCLIEGVYGDVDPPTGLEKSYWDSHGEALGDGSLANYNALNIGAYYGDTGAGRWWAEEKAPTRLGDSTVVYLARWDGERLAPLRSDGDFPWQESSVSVMANRIRSAERPAFVPETEWDRTLGQLPAKGKWGVLLVLGGEIRGNAIDGRGNSVAIFYSGKEGLLIGDECVNVPV